jgi:nitric oxide synthase-interacting protein
VTQLGDIKRQKARLESMKREAEDEQQRARAAARDRVLQDFEKAQLGLPSSTPIATTSGADAKECEYLFLLLMHCPNIWGL